MISENSLCMAKLKNIMCDILQAKKFGVLFCQQKRSMCVSRVKILIWVDSTYYAFKEVFEFSMCIIDFYNLFYC
jgi:hypothetical protein